MGISTVSHPFTPWYQRLRKTSNSFQSTSHCITSGADLSSLLIDIMIPIKVSLIVLTIFCMIIFAGCNEPENELSINWGQNIDEVEIGDDSRTVNQKLGEPDMIYGDDFIGEIYKYSTGKHAVMIISISEDPALGLGTILLEVHPPYSGTTKDGVGIGSSRNTVLDYYGEPDRIEHYRGIYDFGKTSFTIVYDTNWVIIMIQMSALR